MAKEIPQSMAFDNELDVALDRARDLAVAAGRLSLCIDDVLLAIIDHPSLVDWLADRQIDPKILRAELESNISRWPTRRTNDNRKSIGASPAYHEALQRAVVQSIRNGKPLSLADFCEILILDRARPAAKGESACALMLQQLASADEALVRIAEMYWLGGYADWKIGEELGLAYSDVARCLSRAMTILRDKCGPQEWLLRQVPTAPFWRPPSS